MFDNDGRPVSRASPGTPVEVIGWRELPSAGEEILQTESERQAKEVVEWRSQQIKQQQILDDSVAIDRKALQHHTDYSERRQKQLALGRRRSSIYRRDRQKESGGEDSSPELGIVVKGDVDGSLEAILDTIETYRSPQCRLQLLHYGVGAVTPQDVEMAAAFDGIVYGFNVTCPEAVTKLAKSTGVAIKRHNIIYRLLEDLRKELTLRLPALQVEQVLGEANVLELFVVTDGKRKVPVAGCRCVKGCLDKRKLFKLVRRGETIVEGTLSSLKHFKNEVDKVKTDVECGLSFDDRTTYPQTGDVVVCYEMKQVEQKLDWKMDF